MFDKRGRFGSPAQTPSCVNRRVARTVLAVILTMITALAWSATTAFAAGGVTYYCKNQTTGNSYAGSAGTPYWYA